MLVFSSALCVYHVYSHLQVLIFRLDLTGNFKPWLDEAFGLLFCLICCTVRWPSAVIFTTWFVCIKRIEALPWISFVLLGANVLENKHLLQLLQKWVCGWARGNDSCVTNKILIKIKENESVSFWLYLLVQPSNYFGQQICFVDEIWCARNGIEEMKVITSKWLVLLSLLILLLLVSNFCHPILCYSDTLVITPHITHMQIRIHSHPICEVPKYFPN